MDPQHRYARVIRAAAETLGGAGQLAAHLGVTREQLERWASGEESAPFEAFLAGLDVVARGTFARKRRIRVAVLESRDARSASSS